MKEAEIFLSVLNLAAMWYGLELQALASKHKRTLMMESQQNMIMVTKEILMEIQ